MAKDKTGKDFEHLIECFELTLKRFSNTQIIHGEDAYLIDDLGVKRQIDILIKVDEMDGNPCFIAIECKDYERSGVDINEMQAYIKKYEHIPQVKQVFVVGKNGIQRGAIKYANHYGIGLYKVHPIKIEDISDWLGISFITELHADILIKLKSIESHFITKIGRKITPGDEDRHLYRKDKGKMVYLDTLNNYARQLVQKKRELLMNRGMLHRELRPTEEHELINISFGCLVEGIYFKITIGKGGPTEYVEVKTINISLSLHFTEFLRPAAQSLHYKPLNEVSSLHEAKVADFPLIREKNTLRIVQGDMNFYKSFYIDENNNRMALPNIEIDDEKKVYIDYEGIEKPFPNPDNFFKDICIGEKE